MLAAPVVALGPGDATRRGRCASLVGHRVWTLPARRGSRGTSASAARGIEAAQPGPPQRACKRTAVRRRWRQRLFPPREGRSGDTATLLFDLDGFRVRSVTR